MKDPGTLILGFLIALVGILLIVFGYAAGSVMQYILPGGLVIVVGIVMFAFWGMAI